MLPLKRGLWSVSVVLQRPSRVQMDQTPTSLGLNVDSNYQSNKKVIRRQAHGCCPGMPRAEVECEF